MKPIKRTIKKEPINIKDMVYLNSGGPAMTVTDIQECVTVAWISENGIMNTGIMPLACVHK